MTVSQQGMNVRSHHPVEKEDYRPDHGVEADVQLRTSNDRVEIELMTLSKSQTLLLVNNSVEVSFSEETFYHRQRRNDE